MKVLHSAEKSSAESRLCLPRDACTAVDPWKEAEDKFAGENACLLLAAPAYPPSHLLSTSSSMQKPIKTFSKPNAANFLFQGQLVGTAQGSSFPPLSAPASPDSKAPRSVQTDYDLYCSDKRHIIIQHIKQQYGFSGGYNDPRFPIWQKTIERYFKHHKFPKHNWTELGIFALRGQALNIYEDFVQKSIDRKDNWLNFTALFSSQPEKAQLRKQQNLQVLRFRMNGHPKQIVRAFRSKVHPKKFIEEQFFAEFFLMCMPKQIENAVRKHLVRPFELQRVFDAFLNAAKNPIYTVDNSPMETLPGRVPPEYAKPPADSDKNAVQRPSQPTSQENVRKNLPGVLQFNSSVNLQKAPRVASEKHTETEQKARHTPSAPKQNNSCTTLPSVESTHNNSTTESTRHTPFCLNSGLDSNKTNAVAETSVTITDATRIAEQKSEAVGQQQKKLADKNGSDMAFKIGEYVFLSSKAIKGTFAIEKTTKPSYLGPFKITKILTPIACRLNLNNILKGNNAIHFSKLRKFDGTPAKAGYFLNAEYKLKNAEPKKIIPNSLATEKYNTSKTQKEKVNIDESSTNLPKSDVMKKCVDVPCGNNAEISKNKKVQTDIKAAGTESNKIQKEDTIQQFKKKLGCKTEQCTYKSIDRDAEPDKENQMILWNINRNEETKKVRGCRGLKTLRSYNACSPCVPRYTQIFEHLAPHKDTGELHEDKRSEHNNIAKRREEKCPLPYGDVGESDDDGYSVQYDYTEEPNEDESDAEETDEDERPPQYDNTEVSDDDECNVEQAGGDGECLPQYDNREVTDDDECDAEQTDEDERLLQYDNTEGSDESECDAEEPDEDECDAEQADEDGYPLQHDDTAGLDVDGHSIQNNNAIELTLQSKTSENFFQDAYSTKYNKTEEHIITYKAAAEFYTWTGSLPYSNTEEFYGDERALQYDDTQRTYEDECALRYNDAEGIDEDGCPPEYEDAEGTDEDERPPQYDDAEGTDEDGCPPQYDDAEGTDEDGCPPEYEDAEGTKENECPPQYDGAEGTDEDECPPEYEDAEGTDGDGCPPEYEDAEGTDEDGCSPEYDDAEDRDDDQCSPQYDDAEGTDEDGCSPEYDDAGDRDDYGCSGQCDSLGGRDDDECSPQYDNAGEHDDYGCSEQCDYTEEHDGDGYYAEYDNTEDSYGDESNCDYTGEYDEYAY